MSDLRRAAIFSALALCIASAALAEDAPYLEYRFVKGVGQIQMTTGFMERTAELPGRLAALEKQGILILESDVTRTITRSERVGAHQIVTIVVVHPPVGHGEGGASSFVDLKVVMDGANLVDAPLSRASMGIDRMAIDPQRRFVTLDAHDGILRFDGFESKKVVDEDWLDERAAAVRKLCGTR